MNGGADKRELLASLRRQVRLLEAECAAVVDDETSSGVTDPRTLTARERLLVEAERIAQVGSWALHLASNHVYWSDELFRILAVDPGYAGDLVEMFYERVHPDDRAAIRDDHAKLAQRGVVSDTEFRVVWPDGTVRLIQGHGSAVLDASGAPVRFVGTLHDVTALRQAERTRLQDDEMLRAAEALAGVGSFRWNPATGQSVWSAQFRVIAGVAADAAPTLDAFLLRVHPDDRALLQASTIQSLKTGKTESLPLRLVRDDGSLRHVILEGRFLAGGEMLGSVLDVTEVKRLESELFQAQKLEALGRLSGGVAHDFNNILAVLKLGIEARPGSEALMAELSTAIDRGAALTRQLLAFSRKNLLEPRPVDVRELLQQSVTLVGRLLGDAVSAKLVTGSEPLTVHVDPTQLQHTLINLMVNARDAMPKGGTIWLTATGRHFDLSPPGVNPPLEKGAYVEIEIRDEGTGIDASVLPHIFEPFFTTKPAGQGTGLGLASVYGTVSQSGGGLGVLSRAGAGSTFQIYLPRTAGVPAQVPAAVRALRPGRGERVLVIDDLPAIRNLLALILDAAGFEAVCVEDLETLIRDAAKVAGSCHAVVTDIDMPVHSGPEIARILWRHVPSLPVLFMSGHRVLELPSGGAAPTAFLGKPFSTVEVLEQLTLLLGTRKALH